jgi:phospholipase/carboxylesterase
MNEDLGLFEHTIIENVTRKTLFLLHGTGGTKQDFLFLDQLLHNQYTLVGLRGNVDEYGARRFFARQSEGVFDQESIKKETSKLDRFIASWRKTHYLESCDTAFLGYSNGANMLLAALFLYPDHFKTLALLHPMLPMIPSDELALTGKNVFVSYGKDDEMITPQQSKNVADVLIERGATVLLREYPAGHGVHQSEIGDLVEFLKNTVQ